MNKCIFVISVGPSYAKMASLLKKSLDLRGNFDGELIAFTDANLDGYTNHKSYLVKTNNNYLKKIYALRYLYDNYKDIDSFLFLDTDILVFNDVNCLFNDKSFSTAIRVHELAKYKSNMTTFCEYLTPAEKQEYGELYGISSGQWSIAREYIPDFLNEFDSIYNYNPKRLTADQSIINALFVRKRLKICMWESKWVQYPYRDMVFNQSESVICHYVPKPKIDYMQKDYISLIGNP